MGFGNMVAGAAVDAAAKQAEMKRMLKGRTPEQQSVINTFTERADACPKD